MRIKTYVAATLLAVSLSQGAFAVTPVTINFTVDTTPQVWCNSGSRAGFEFTVYGCSPTTPCYTNANAVPYSSAKLGSVLFNSANDVPNPTIRVTIADNTTYQYLMVVATPKGSTALANCKVPSGAAPMATMNTTSYYYFTQQCTQYIPTNTTIMIEDGATKQLSSLLGNNPPTFCGSGATK